MGDNTRLCLAWTDPGTKGFGKARKRYSSGRLLSDKESTVPVKETASDRHQALCVTVFVAKPCCRVVMDINHTPGNMIRRKRLDMLLCPDRTRSLLQATQSLAASQSDTKIGRLYVEGVEPSVSFSCFTFTFWIA